MVTTPRHGGLHLEQQARELAETVGGVFQPRQDRSLEDLAAFGWPVVVLTQQGMQVHTPEGILYYHPGMGKPRIKRLKKGGQDPMVVAMDLSAGQSVLDCTLGLGSDALVASYVVGPSGRVVGWESIPLLAELVRRGLQEYEDDDPSVVEAMRRIRVENRDHRVALATLASRSFDVVYFDPMFREPVHLSAHMRPLRLLVDQRPLEEAVVQEALRVARRRVVIKERRDSPLFARWGVRKLVGGRNSRVVYGVLEVPEEGNWGEGDRPGEVTGP